MKIILPIFILATGLITYWLLWAYFLWDINWLSTMGEITQQEREDRFFAYMMLQLLCVMPFIPAIVENT